MSPEIISYRQARMDDFQELQKLERACFPKYMQTSDETIKRSLSSNFQYIIVAELQRPEEKKILGSATLYIYQKTLRIFSIAVFPEHQRSSIGNGILLKIIEFARNNKLKRITLEAKHNNKKLIEFYKKSGFQIIKFLPDYYSKHKDGVRMELFLEYNQEKQSTSNIIIVKDPKEWKLEIENVKIISSKDYITKPEYQSLKNVRVFNLSNSYRYQKMGYYVSLLASAREHRVIPNITTMRDFTSISLIRSISGYIDEYIQKSLKNVELKKLSLNIYFGRSTNSKFKFLAQKLYYIFEAPLLCIDFVKSEKWSIQKVTPLSLKNIPEEDMDAVKEFAKSYFSKKRFQKPRFKNYKYDLAILVNPKEQNPPSCQVALQNFKKAAEKTGFYTDFITKEDYSQISEYDALFIRETTNVIDHTYQFSRAAYAEGLVVIDDPWSILRCSNKIFLHERMKQNKIKTPETLVLSKFSFKMSAPFMLNFPVILKQPDSAFSLGVEKAENMKELAYKLQKLFRYSDLIIAQEFIPSEFDWRIGILDNAPLFACKYYMADGHWQIYDWNSKNKINWGKTETVATENVPENILKTAIKAASFMGDGLYGVDLKVINNEVYIIEVNDNPNIDHGIEDNILKDEIYNRIIRSIFNRIEMNRNITQYISENKY